MLLYEKFFLLFKNSVKEVVDSILITIKQIADGSKEQLIGIEQINTTVNQLEGVLNQNASLSKELTDTSNSLKKNSNDMQELVRKFEVYEKTIKTLSVQLKYQSVSHPYYQTV